VHAARGPTAPAGRHPLEVRFAHLQHRAEFLGKEFRRAAAFSDERSSTSTPQRPAKAISPSVTIRPIAVV